MVKKVSKFTVNVATLWDFSNDTLTLLAALTTNHTATSIQSDLLGAAIGSEDLCKYQNILAHLVSYIAAGDDDNKGEGASQNEPVASGVGELIAVTETVAEWATRSKYFLVSNSFPRRRVICLSL